MLLHEHTSFSSFWMVSYQIWCKRKINKFTVEYVECTINYDQDLIPDVCASRLIFCKEISHSEYTTAYAYSTPSISTSCAEKSRNFTQSPGTTSQHRFPSILHSYYSVSSRSGPTFITLVVVGCSTQIKIEPLLLISCFSNKPSQKWNHYP